MRTTLALSLCIIAHLLGSGQVVHEVTPLQIPGAGEDYAPVWLDSGFVMCSVREGSGAIDFRNEETGKPLSDLYWVKMSDGKAAAPILFSTNLTSVVNEGPSTFAQNGAFICYTRNLTLPKRMSNLRGSDGQLGLFFSRLENGIWSAPVPFAYNSPKYAVMHPALTPTGDTLVFASNMPGSLGGMDLYCSVRSGDGWTAPQNLGPSVNGQNNEAYPSFGLNGELYFSSDRAGGPGGLDIYSVPAFETGPALPAALPEPINSANNDMGVTHMTDGQTLLFSSDRTGKEQIHMVKRTVPKFRNCAPQQQNNYCYAFKVRPHAAMRSLPLEHVWDLGDGTRATSLAVDHCYQSAGTYTVRSMLVDKRSGAIFHTLSSNDLTITDHTQAYIAIDDTVRTGRMIALHPGLSNLPEFEVAEHHWDMGDGSLLSGSAIVHQFKAAGTFEIRLDVLSTPDAQGAIRNQCNTKRVVVLDRFRDHEDLQVTAVYQDAFGKSHAFTYQELPFDASGLTLDELEDATFSVQLFTSRERLSLDDPRFAEIRKFYPVIERFDPHSNSYLYLVGETKTLDELYEVFRKVKELQFLDAEVFALNEEKLVDLSQLDFASLQDLNNKKLRTNSIHFAFKSATLDSASSPVLGQLKQLLLQHKELMLVIEAHTDDIGGVDYNVDLAQQRAQSVVNELTALGVNGERLIPIGHGKNQPIASNRTEEGRAQNRRVEFRMVVKGEEQAFERTR